MSTDPSLFLSSVVVAVAAACALKAQQQVPLGSLDLAHVRQTWGDAHRDHSVDGHALEIGGRTFERGLGMHAHSELLLDLADKGQGFHVFFGADDEMLPQKGSIGFRVLGDDKVLWQSGVVHSGDAAKEVDMPLAGVKVLGPVVEDCGDEINYDHADWAEAVLTLADGAKVRLPDPPHEEPVILTPNLLADRRSLTLQIESRITAAGAVSKSTFVALRSGEAAVLFHGRSDDRTETLLFVRPDVIKRSPKVAVRRAVR